jgi:hypothetical protein
VAAWCDAAEVVARNVLAKLEKTPSPNKTAKRKVVTSEG